MVTVLALTRVLLDMVGDRDPLFYCLPASVLAILAAAIFDVHHRRFGDLGRLVIGSVAGFSGFCGFSSPF